MFERSYSNNQLVEIIRSALALALCRGGRLEEYGKGADDMLTEGADLDEYVKAADRMLAEGVDLNTTFVALRRYLRHSRAQSRPPTDFRNPQWLERWKHWQLVTLHEVARDKADALAILRAALAGASPFVTIPKLGKAFHIRYGPDISDVTDYGSDISGIEIVTDDNSIPPGSNVVMRLRPTKHEGGRPSVPQKLIDKLDRKACATLTAEGKSLKKEARANLIKPDLATKGYDLAEGTIKNRLKAKRP